MTALEQCEYAEGMMFVFDRLAVMFPQNKELIPIWLSSSNRAFSSPFECYSTQTT